MHNSKRFTLATVYFNIDPYPPPKKLRLQLLYGVAQQAHSDLGGIYTIQEGSQTNDLPLWKQNLGQGAIWFSEKGIFP